MVTREQLTEARDAALRCFRSYCRVLRESMSLAHAKEADQDECRDLLAQGAGKLAAVYIEAQRAVDADVMDAILVAAAGEPPPPRCSTWHGLALRNAHDLLAFAVFGVGIDAWAYRGERLGEPSLRLAGPEDADKLRQRVQNCSHDIVRQLVSRFYWEKKEADKLDHDIAAGIEREWGRAVALMNCAAHNESPPPPPNPQAHGAHQAHRTAIFPEGEPLDPDLRDLAVRLDSNAGLLEAGKTTKIAIALEITNGKRDKAKQLLGRLRRMKPKKYTGP